MLLGIFYRTKKFDNIISTISDLVQTGRTWYATMCDCGIRVYGIGSIAVTWRFDKL